MAGAPPANAGSMTPSMRIKSAVLISLVLMNRPSW
jgi:hypothetical protein